MTDFGKSLTRELGKNTGKWISNKVFGDKWSTPHRLRIETEQRREERERARRYRQREEDRRRNERDQRRQDKQLEKMEEAAAKQRLIADNSVEVAEHSNYLKSLKSFHHTYNDKADWSVNSFSMDQEAPSNGEDIRKEISDNVNKVIDEKEILLRKQYPLSIGSKVFGTSSISRYVILICSSWWFLIIGVFALAWLGGRLQIFNITNAASVILFVLNRLAVNAKRGLATSSILDQELRDLKDSRNVVVDNLVEKQNELLKEYQKELERLKRLSEISEGIRKKDELTYSSALVALQAFDDIKSEGFDVDTAFDKGICSMKLYALSSQDIPNYDLKTIRNGVVLKEEDMPVSKFNEFYKDVIGSVALRSVKEVFQILPIDQINVDVFIHEINPSTGNKEEVLIISFVCNRDNFEELNLPLTVPGKALEHLGARMHFLKTKGFQPLN